MTLKSFPRGGKNPLDKKSLESPLFKTSVKTKKKSGDAKKKAKEASKEDTNLVATTAERLSYGTLCEGLVILGRIFEVTQYDLIVSLPGGIVGRVQVTDISESYTNLLQSIIKSEDSDQSEFKSLPEIYSPGDYVVCYVKSLQPEEKWQVVLSLEPRLINQNVDMNYFIKGSKMVCTVNSIEDHGYVVDTGISNVRAFIPSKEVDKSKSYCPGRQLLCHVIELKTVESTSTITLSAKRKHVEAVQASEIKSLDVIMPGTKFTLRVKKLLSNGLQVSFHKNVAYVNQLYLKESLSEYSKGMEVTGTLLYIVPTLKFAYFTLLDSHKDEGIKPGAIITKAIFLFRESNGIVLQLNENGSRGFVPLKRTEVDFEKILEKFTPGSKHKCRVLSYNWMDGTYVCTMQRAILEQKHFSLLDVKPGDMINVTIKNINYHTGFVNIQSGKINGYVAPEHLSDDGLSGLKNLKIGDRKQARVLGIDSERHRIYATFKKSLIMSDLPVLSDIKEAKRGSQHHGTIVQINKNGLLVRFFEDVKGWVPRTALNKESAHVNWNYSIGQTVTVKIENVDENLGKMSLSIVTKEKIKEEECDFVIGERVDGTITESSIQGVYIRISKNDGKNISTGFLPAGHMSPCVEIAGLLASKCVPGDTLSALVFSTAPSLILTRTFLPQEGHRKFDELKVGDCIPCSIRDIEPDGVRVILPIIDTTPFAYISLSNVSNFKLVYVHQILFAKIMAINKKEKQITSLTMIYKKLHDGLPDSKNRMMVAVDTLSLYLNKFSELAENPFYQNRPISSVKLGQKVSGVVQKIITDGLVIQLKNNLTGIVRKDHYSGNLKVGDEVTGTIMWINFVNEFVDITLLPVVMNSISATRQNKQAILPVGTVLRAQILMVTNWFILIVVKGNGKGCLAALPARRHINDIEPDLTPYVVHARVRCYVILNGNESDVVPVCMVKSAFESDKRGDETKPALKRKQRGKGINEVPNKKIKTEDSESETECVNITKKQEKNAKKRKNNKEEVDSKEDVKTEVQEETDEETDHQKLNEKQKKKIEEKPRIPECGFLWFNKPVSSVAEKHESSSEDEDDVEQESKQKKKKLNAAERREQERQKEREIRQREEALASNQLPNSVDQFDRLVLASQNNSLIWLQYMAYHLQATEIEKARAVARRAIKTINCRDEKEKLNVWLGWLNLESKFGTPESLSEVFVEASRRNDALEVYTHMLDVHVEAGRQTELEQLISTMLGKFKESPKVWHDCGTALLKLGLKDKSRHIMQRALQYLPQQSHVNILLWFAMSENKYGDKERAQTLYEQILSSYPKRVDVWQTYVDSLVKSDDIDIARKVLERAAVQKLPPRKMKSIFGIFIRFEEKHGTPESVARVQQMAVDYVEKQCNKESA